MINQYRAQCGRPAEHGKGGLIGQYPAGTILPVNNFVQAFSNRTFSIGRGPWIIEAWLNREYHKFIAGRCFTVYLAGGHLAEIRSLSTGKRARISDAHIRATMDN